MNSKTGKNYCKLDPRRIKDPNFGIPACLRKKTPQVTPSEKPKETNKSNDKINEPNIRPKDMTQDKTNKTKKGKERKVLDTEKICLIKMRLKGAIAQSGQK